VGLEIVSSPTLLPAFWKNVLFNDVVSCWGFITLVMVERVQSINGMMLTGKKPKYSEKNLSQFQFVQH